MRAILLGALGACACGLELWLVAAGTSVVTVAQRDRFRSARAPRTCDVSADGRFVAFESFAPLAPADGDQMADVYVLDRAHGHVTLESLDIPAGGEAAHPRISGDGRFIVFEVRDMDRGPRSDIVLRDRVAATTRSLTSHVSPGDFFAWSRNPDISDSGQVVAFSSAATTLIDGVDANGAHEDVYVIEIGSGNVRRASVTTSGLQPSAGSSIVPSLSADGRWVAFSSTAPLDSGVSRRLDVESRVRRVFLRDLTRGATHLVSRPRRGPSPDGDSSLPSVSGDGRFVAFTSDASNLDGGEGSNRGADVFLFDRESGRISRVSRAADGSAASGASANSSISSDARFIAFQSTAGNLACSERCSRVQEDINLLWDVFVFDRTTGITVRASDDELGGWMEVSVAPSLDGSGRVVAFSSRHPTDDGDRADDLDLFVRLLAPPPLTGNAPQR
jgi:Tol biopolymer transport system component